MTVRLHTRLKEIIEKEEVCRVMGIDRAGVHVHHRPDAGQWAYSFHANANPTSRLMPRRPWRLGNDRQWGLGWIGGVWKQPRPVMNSDRINEISGVVTPYAAIARRSHTTWYTRLQNPKPRKNPKNPSAHSRWLAQERAKRLVGPITKLPAGMASVPAIRPGDSFRYGNGNSRGRGEGGRIGCRPRRRSRILFVSLNLCPCAHLRHSISSPPTPSAPCVSTPSIARAHRAGP